MTRQPRCGTSSTRPSAASTFSASRSGVRLICQSLGQRLLVDPLAGRQLALEDHRAQPRGHAIVQRGAAQGMGSTMGSR